MALYLDAAYFIILLCLTPHGFTPKGGRVLIGLNYLFSALVWGSSVKHNPQKVGKEHKLNDEDVVQIVKK